MRADRSPLRINHFDGNQPPAGRVCHGIPRRLVFMACYKFRQSSLPCHNIKRRLLKRRSRGLRKFNLRQIQGAVAQVAAAEGK